MQTQQATCILWPVCQDRATYIREREVKRKWKLQPLTFIINVEFFLQCSLMQGSHDYTEHENSHIPQLFPQTLLMDYVSLKFVSLYHFPSFDRDPSLKASLINCPDFQFQQPFCPLMSGRELFWVSSLITEGKCMDWNSSIPGLTGNRCGT